MAIEQKQKKPRGVPTKMTEAVLGIIETAWSVGANNEIACAHAGIDPTTLYDYLRLHPDFAQKKFAYKQKLKLQALDNTAKALKDKDMQTTRWYLERQMKDEFSNRTEHTGKNGDPMAFSLSALSDAVDKEREEQDVEKKED